MTRTDTPTNRDERTTITTLLDYARATVRAKCGPTRTRSEMRIAVDTPIADLLDADDARSESATAGSWPPATWTAWRRTGCHGEPFTLRWILLHPVEEIARHNGHLDVLRELSGGTTGA